MINTSPFDLVIILKYTLIHLASVFVNWGNYTNAKAI